MKKANSKVKIKSFLKVILIIVAVLIVAAVAVASTYYVMRRNISNGADGQTPYIGDNGNWFIGNVDTGIKAGGKDGADGQTPYIGDNGNWFIGNVDTGIKAEGKDGADGQTPYIGDNGNWFIGDIDTGVKAEGKDGVLTNTGCVASGAGQLYYDVTMFQERCRGYVQYFRTGQSSGYLNLSISLFNATNENIYRYLDLESISYVLGINLKKPTSLSVGAPTGYWVPVNTKADIKELSGYGTTCVYNTEEHICLARIYNDSFAVGAWQIDILDVLDEEWSTYLLMGIAVEEA